MVSGCWSRWNGYDETDWAASKKVTVGRERINASGLNIEARRGESGRKRRPWLIAGFLLSEEVEEGFFSNLAGGREFQLSNCSQRQTSSSSGASGDAGVQKQRPGNRGQRPGLLGFGQDNLHQQRR